MKKRIEVSNNLEKVIFKLQEKLFLDEYRNPIILAETQKKFYEWIVFKKYPRIGVITPTQYGKSLTIALSIITRVVVLPERWVIIGGTKSKGEIIMGYIIDHLFDNPILCSQLTIDTKLEQLKRERKRDHLTFRRGGEVFILSAEYRNRKRIGEALLGFGSQNIVLDDSCLCDDDTYAYVKRMLGGKKDTFMVETSNPLKLNHFYRTMTSDEKYKKIWIDWKVAVKEGRFTEEFIEEMKRLPFFKQFYECQFPDEKDIDEKGYMLLLSPDDLMNLFIEERDFEDESEAVLGVDIGRGGNFNVFVLRKGLEAKIILKDRNPDLMSTAGRVIQIIKEYKVKPENVYIDDIGVGGGVVARLKEQKYNVNGINFGEVSKLELTKNLRAEAYWKLREWIKSGGKILGEDSRLFDELKIIKYKVDSSGKIQIQPKEELMLYGIDSPDEADALALTFCEKRRAELITKEKVEQKKGIKTDYDKIREFYEKSIKEALISKDFF